MKGIVLAGGLGSRLFPSTTSISKQLIPIYDKPLIYYPLSVLMLSDIKDILIICLDDQLDLYRKLLGDGSSLGLNISYLVQDKPRGVADAFLISEDFIAGERVCLVLGDNIFWGQGFTKILQRSRRVKGARIFGYKVENPKSFGVAVLNKNGDVVKIEEKPQNPKSNIAVTGLYFYDETVVEKAKKLKPSERGELEITDLNNMYLKEKKLDINIFGRGFAWLDTGTPESLLEASNFVGMIEKRQGQKIACLEEIAFAKSWISRKNLSKKIKKLPDSSYKDYLKKVIS